MRNQLSFERIRLFKANWKRSLGHLGRSSESKKLKCQKSKTGNDQPMDGQAVGWTDKAGWSRVARDRKIDQRYMDGN